MTTLKHTRELASSRLSANAKAMAEHEREPFVIAQHLLMTLAGNREVIDMTDGCAGALGAALRDYKPIVNFARSDQSGAVRCSVLPIEQGLSLARERWWQGVVTSNRLTITKPVTGMVSKREILALMLPIRAADGSQDGALGASIDIAYLKRSLSGAVEAKTGVVAIVTAQGLLVAEGNTPLPFKPLLAGTTTDIRMARAADGETWMYATAKLYGADLSVVYAEPRDTLMAAALWQIRSSILLPLISLLLASVAIALGTDRLVVRWLRDLGRVANRFANGDFSSDRSRFEMAPDEVVELSANLHSMAEVIDRRNRELKQALVAQTELTREVHHRVKNNLQIITSLLTLQAGRVNEPTAKEVLGQTRTRISALALMHRLLYEQESGNERGHVMIGEMLEALCQQLRATHLDRPAIMLRCETIEEAVDIDHAVPLGLFAVEAVTNAYRHGFGYSDEGEIILRFQHDVGHLVVEIVDNGTGYTIEDVKNGIGMELMAAFAVQVGGDLHRTSEIGIGTRVMLRLPVRD
ncbi:MAG: sensor histidine kinase [Sphingorhabdus sp.]